MRWVRVAAVGLLVCLGVSVAPGAHAAPVAVVDVVGDDNVDAFVGTGGLVLPGRFTGSSATRWHVASCLGCTWKYTVYCAYDADGLCAHAVVTCPVGQVRYRVWFGRTPESVAVIGSVCWGAGRPLTRRDIDRAIAQRGVALVPPLRPGYDPPGGTLVLVPAIVWAGQPATLRPPAMRLSGMTVQLTCRGRWLWSWADGGSDWVAVPGAPYPSQAVSHAYRAAGRYRVTVTSRWTADYTVAGLGPFAASGDVVGQRGTVMITVRGAGTRLTPWNTTGPASVIPSDPGPAA